MNNPWKQLDYTDKKRIIASCDKDALKNYEQKLEKYGDDYKLDLEYIPGPYMGNPKEATLFLLNLNPNWANGKEFYAKQEDTLKKNLEHRIDNCPLFCLDPKWKDDYDWWYGKLKGLIDEIDLINKKGLETVRRKVFVAEYFPYSSKSYREVNIILESQKYTFQLVREAIIAKKTIVVMRHETEWDAAVPELVGYEKKYIVKNPQQPYIGPGKIAINVDFKKIKSSFL